MKRLWRTRRRSVLVALGTLVVIATTLWQIARGRSEPYVPGTVREGLVDSLARERPSEIPRVVYRDVSAERGFAWRHFPATRTGRLPEDMGSGVALGDVDGDGWTDVFLVGEVGPLSSDDPASASGAGRCALLKNRRDGTFEDISAESGTTLALLGMGAAFCDVDSDGDLDLFVSAYGRCRLLVNDGSGHFTDGSARAGLDAFEGFWTGLAASDYDENGTLDLYVCGYVHYVEHVVDPNAVAPQFDRDIPALLNPSSFEPERNLLLSGRGDGTFEEVAEAAGVANPTGRSLGAVFADFNDDGLPDLYVANDVSDNALFLNRGDGTFEDATTEALVGDYRGAMGLAVADFDRDRDLDLFITHWIGQENALYARVGLRERAVGGPGLPIFSDVSSGHGVGHTALDRVGWACRFFDYDNDGRLDLFVVNGSTIPERDNPQQLTPQRSQLFWNSPRRRGWDEIGAETGAFFREEHVGRGGATFDFDLDGDEDLVVTLHGEPAVLLENEGGERGGALRLRLRQPTGNTFALGTRVLVVAGDLEQLDELGTQGSYLSQHAVGELAFGLGGRRLVERIEVTWPDGARESAGPFPADTLVTWRRGEAPRVEPLPGRPEACLAPPAAVEDLRSFHRLAGEARAARVAGRLRESAELYERALELWPTHGDSLYYLGNLAVALGDEARARDLFRRCTAFHPAVSRGWIQRGRLALPGGDPALDDLDEAEHCFRRAHELNAEESRPVTLLGAVAMLRGDLDEAARWLDDAAAMNHRSVEARWLRAQVAWLAGDDDLAAERLAEARAIARAGGESAPSVSSEGDTRTGNALTAEIDVPLAPSLAGWRGLASRAGGPAEEFGPR